MIERTDRVEELFQAALEHGVGQRAAFLLAACSTDHSLRAEVESLISAHEKAGSFLDSPVRTGAYEMTETEHPEPVVGREIGYYKVVALIGRGAMGDVYLAIDKRLGRKVALKLLPRRFTGDELRLRRFALEARAASSLNHPNIITIYDIGHVEAVHFIAAEFVNGQTLRSRLLGGSLVAKEAVEIGIAVTSALTAAHAAGIVHRDIKPENIMIRPDGYVKVLDFGLAKLMEQVDVPIDSDAPTVFKMETDPGTIMGTPCYMSPEQVRALEVDGRSDVFNTGVVLFEMITGRLPFEGTTSADVFASILKSEPPELVRFAPDAGPELQQIVSKALRKDKEERYQRVEELLADLKTLRDNLLVQSSGDAARATSKPGVASPLARLVFAGIALILLATITIIGLGWKLGQKGSDFNRLGFSEIHSWKSERGEAPVDARFSHDGRMIAFPMLRNKELGIWVKQVSGAAEPLLITSEHSDNWWPVWSSDDQQIAFVSVRAGAVGIWSCPATGGPATLLLSLDDRRARTRSWSKDDKTIYFELGNNLRALDIDRGTVRQLTHLQAGSSYRHFSVSPDEDRICYVEFQNGQSDIWVLPLGGGDAFRVTNDVEEDRYPLWHPDGKRIIYTSNRGGAFQICIAYLDGENPKQVTVSATDHIVSDVSGNGTRLLDVGSRSDADIFGVEANSSRESQLTSRANVELWPDVSPDGQTIAYQSTNAIGKLLSSNITVRPANNDGSPTSLSSSGFSPSWAPNGSKLSFLRFANSRIDIFTVSLPSGEEKQLTSDGIFTKGHDLLPSTKFGRSVSWSPDSERIVYSSRRSGAPNLWQVNADGSGQTQLSSNTDPNLLLFEPTFSPDGNRIAYVTETLRPASGTAKTWSLCVFEKNRSRVVLKADSLIRPCGWSTAGTELVAAIAEERNPSDRYPMKVKLIQIPLEGDRHSIATLEDTYFWTIELGSDGRSIAFVSSRDNFDNIWFCDVAGTNVRRITANRDPKLYFPTVAWAASGKSIYFAKQTNMGLITLIDNFD